MPGPPSSDDDLDEEDVDEDGAPWEPDAVELPVDGVLDLHTFAPREVKALTADYLDECWDRGIREVRIIHGKGVGTLRRIVHSVLERHPRVRAFRAGREGEGGWGATVVTLAETAAGSPDGAPKTERGD